MRRLFCSLIVIGWGVSASLPASAALDRVMALEPVQSLTLAQAGKARFADVAFPDSERADQWLAQHLLQQEIDITPLEQDRYGRQLFYAPASEQMLRDGVAIIFAQDPVPATWLAAEAEAKAAKRGVWGVEGLVLTPEQAAVHLYEFHVVEGALKRSYTNRTKTYLNFGDRWQEDFSVTISGRTRKAVLEKLGQLEPGTRLRVRGTIYSENGPMIRITQPEQIEILR